MPSPENKLSIQSIARDAERLRISMTTGLSGTYLLRTDFTKVLLFHGTDQVARYAGTSAGLDLALAAAVAGDFILLPGLTISGDHTLIAGTTVAGWGYDMSILTGQITGASGARLEHVAVTRSANNANPLRGIVSPAAGVFYVRHCSISCTQAGAGRASAVYGSAAEIQCHDCSIYASSAGIGFGVETTSTAAKIYIYGGKIQGLSAGLNSPCYEGG